MTPMLHGEGLGARSSLTQFWGSSCIRSVAGQGSQPLSLLPTAMLTTTRISKVLERPDPNSNIPDSTQTGLALRPRGDRHLAPYHHTKRASLHP